MNVLQLDGGMYVHRGGMTVFGGGLYVTTSGLTVHDGGALIRGRLSNTSFALNLKLKGNLADLESRKVFELFACCESMFLEIKDPLVIIGV
jgi:hypothetical protein